MSKLKDIEWLFNGRHSDPEIIVLCVRWYLHYKLSLPDLVERRPNTACRCRTGSVAIRSY